ncbi:MAG: ATP-dependent RNA helicase HrpA [Lysobacteraceae bacterium]
MTLCSDWRRQVLSRDRARLEGLFRRAQGRGRRAAKPPESRNRGETKPADAMAAFNQAVADSAAARERRVASLPKPGLTADLPILVEAESIIAAIRAHPVVVIAGETGSGKTTQLPQLCLAAGRGEAGLIGCTQPRRIAVRSVASRVASELNCELGTAVGYQVRFTERVSPDSAIKFMTDGILLAEIQRDRWLSAYDTLIIDEAHERSLNIDFLLGYLKGLLKKRRDLRLIVTSATIDTARFAAHFDGAPVIEVEGRTYPVETRYRPALDSESGERSVPSRIVSAMEEIDREDGRGDVLGDVLVFLPGEREIRDAHQALSQRGFRHTEVLPLYARLSARDQDRVFRPHAGRRIVLSTNVAETSLTVPGIRYVIDPGQARVKRYSARRKLDSLQIEPISQASANQRAGRCGRVGPGICYRLYAEDDFEARPEFTDPEILRASLGGVILRMLDLGLGDIDDFPFVERPTDRAIADGWQQLTELGAVDTQRKLTVIGRQMAKLPVDVKLSRMLIAARDGGCLEELLVITAFLSIQDPRERPADARQAADEAHAHYADPQSDFAAILALWRDYRDQHEALSQAKLRDWCTRRFLGFLRMREWRELHRQLKLIVDGFGWARNDKPANYEVLHLAILSGLPTQIGRREDSREYLGPRQRRFTLFPASPLAKKPPRWVLSGELLETRQLYGLTNARIEPEWVIAAAPQLIATRHFDPHWSEKQGRALVYEQRSIFGLTLVERKRVGYAAIDAADARRVFIEALAQDRVRSTCGFVDHNRRELEKAMEEEARLRRSDLVADDAWREHFYAGRIPPDILSVKALEAWWRRADKGARSSLQWSLEDLLPAAGRDPDRFPVELRLGEQALRIRYLFEPGSAEDGATLELPLYLLNAVESSMLDWAVPGFMEEAATALIRGLPKALRRNVVPAPDFARAFAETGPHRADASKQGLVASLAGFLAQRTGIDFEPAQFDPTAVPAHLCVRIELSEVVDGKRHVRATSRDLDELKRRFGDRADAAFGREAGRELPSTKDRIDAAPSFPEQTVPECMDGAGGVPAFPALVEKDGRFDVQAFARRDRADLEHGRAVRRLLALQLEREMKRATKQLPISPRAAMLAAALEGQQQLRRELVNAAFNALAADDLVAIRDATAFETRLELIRRQLFGAAIERCELAERILEAVAELRPQLEQSLMGFATASYADLRQQFDALIFPGFIAAHPLEQLTELPRFLEAMRLRVERLQRDPARDEARLLELKPFVDGLATAGPAKRDSAAFQHLRWLLEEWRVSLFAQELGTREPVSAKRLARRLADL